MIGKISTQHFRLLNTQYEGPGGEQALVLVGAHDDLPRVDLPGSHGVGRQLRHVMIVMSCHVTTCDVMLPG